MKDVQRIFICLTIFAAPKLNELESCFSVILHRPKLYAKYFFCNTLMKHIKEVLQLLSIALP